MKEERREEGERKEMEKRERRGMKKKRRKEKLEIGFFSPASASTLFSLMYFSISLSARGR